MRKEGYVHVLEPVESFPGSMAGGIVLLDKHEAPVGLEFFIEIEKRSIEDLVCITVCIHSTSLPSFEFQHLQGTTGTLCNATPDHDPDW